MLMGKMLLLASLGLLWPLLMTLWSKRSHSPTVAYKNHSLSSTLIYLQHFTESWNMRYIWTFSLLRTHITKNRQLGIIEGNLILETKYKSFKLFSYEIHLTLMWHYRLAFKVLVSCPQPASVQGKARMVTCAAHCRVSACVSQGWWASVVTTVPLDSGSLSAQVTTSRTTILMKSIRDWTVATVRPVIFNVALFLFFSFG